MATSGTVGQTVVQVDDLLGQAAKRAGYEEVVLTVDDADTLSRSLFYLLTQLSNIGINLWCQERTLLGVYPFQPEITTPVGTVDVLRVLHRLPSRLQPETLTSAAGGLAANATDGDVDTVLTQGAALGDLEFDFGSGNSNVVRLVGLLPGATAALTLAFETSADGITWTTRLSVAAATYTDGEWAWFELLTPAQARYFRVRAVLGTLVMREVFVAATWRDLVVTRMSRDVYSSLPNKRTTSSRPNQYWLDRREVPVIVLWPESNTTFALLQVFRHRHVEDVGALSNTLEVPQRWLPYVQAELARRACLDLAKADKTRLKDLEAEAGRELQIVEGEERDNSPVMLGVDLTAYTR